MQNGTFYSTSTFAHIWCRAFGRGCTPISVPVLGSGPPRTMHMIRTPDRYRSHHISSGYSADFCVSPGWEDKLDRSTVKYALDHLQGLRTRTLLWKVRFDHAQLAEVLSELAIPSHRVRIHVLPLEKGYDRIVSAYHATTRNHLNKAQRRGLSIRATVATSDILAFQLVYTRLAEQKGWTFIYPAALTTGLVRLPETCKFFVAEHEGRIVGGALFLRDGDSVYYLFGASDRRYAHLHASNALIDSGIRWACEVGATFLNLGNSGSVESLARFKSSWGASIEHNWLFTWSNPAWQAASRVKANFRALVRRSRPNPTSGPVTLVTNEPTTWAQRSALAELPAVLYAGGSERKNLMIHGASVAAAEITISLARKSGWRQPKILDYGCGNGRMLRFFGKHGFSILGTDITQEMLDAAKRFGLPVGARLWTTDGPTIPLEDHSVDIVWVSGVLKYTLFPPGSECLHRSWNDSSWDLFVPTYSDIAREMFRILRPGGFVANVEMWVDSPLDTFTSGFEAAGFVTEQKGVLRRYLGIPERCCEWRDGYRLPPRLVVILAKACAKLRLRFDDPTRTSGGFRDYFFIWRKHGSAEKHPNERHRIAHAQA